jgi:hypothetical protein
MDNRPRRMISQSNDNKQATYFINLNENSKFTQVIDGQSKLLKGFSIFHSKGAAFLVKKRHSQER